MSVGEICNRDVVVIDKSSSVIEAAKCMRHHHVGALVVVEDDGEDRRPIGIITDRDIVIEVLGEEVDINSVMVGDIMSADVITAAEGDGIWETVQRMRAKGVRRMPVVNPDGYLQGVLAVDDLLELLAEEFSDLTRLIAREQVREQRIHV